MINWEWFKLPAQIAVGLILSDLFRLLAGLLLKAVSGGSGWMR